MGDLVLSGGGSTAVATDELLDHGRRLNAVATSIDESLATLRVAAAATPRLPAPLWQPGGVESCLLEARVALGAAGDLAHSLAVRLQEAAENYGAAERSAWRYLQQTAALAGYGLGLASPLLAVLALDAAMAGAAAFLVSTLFTGSAQASEAALRQWLFEHRGILVDPRFVAFVRLAVSSADETLLGAGHVPYPLVQAAGEDGFGWFGLHGAAATAIALGGPALLKETPVAVRKASTAFAGPPDSYAQLAARIPDSDPGSAQIRVEQYDVPGGRPRWIVYFGGTINPGLSTAGEPWDDTSNLQGIAGKDPGSVRAARQALARAGARPGDQVLPVGYSQGGIVATEIVRTGGFRTPGLVTFGSPTGQVPLPDHVDDVAVEIEEDLIPALGGLPLPPERGGLDRLVVRRSIYDGHPPDTAALLPAHDLGNYQDTASKMDAARDPRLLQLRTKITAFTGGATAQVSLWRADRVSTGDGGGGPAAAVR